MGAEALAALLVALLAMGVLLAPLIWPGTASRGGNAIAPPELEDTPRGQALIALKEIDFDRATGKLSDADYEELKARYSARALALLDAVEATGAPACPSCGAVLVKESLFCELCGAAVSSRA
jgi:hypothetical protein